MYRLHICVACVFQKFTMFDILAMSLKKMMKSNRPNIDPSGTPDTNWYEFEILLQCWIFFNNTDCLTVSVKMVVVISLDRFNRNNLFKSKH